jgi:hypothetical protein
MLNLMNLDHTQVPWQWKHFSTLWKGWAVKEGHVIRNQKPVSRKVKVEVSAHANEQTQPVEQIVPVAEWTLHTWYIDKITHEKFRTTQPIHNWHRLVILPNASSQMKFAQKSKVLKFESKKTICDNIHKLYRNLLQEGCWLLSSAYLWDNSLQWDNRLWWDTLQMIECTKTGVLLTGICAQPPNPYNSALKHEP